MVGGLLTVFSSSDGIATTVHTQAYLMAQSFGS